MDRKGNFELLPGHLEPGTPPRPDRLKRFVLAALGLFLLVSVVSPIIHGLARLSSQSASSSSPLSSFAHVADATECMEQLQYTTRSSHAASFGGGRSFGVVQKLGRRQAWKGFAPHVFGEVAFVPGDDNEEARIDVEVASSAESVDVQVLFDPAGEGLQVTTPASAPRQVCIRLGITVHVPADARADALAVEAATLKVRVAPGLSLAVATTAALGTAAGGIVLPGEPGAHALTASEMRVASASGDVSGWFPLRDALRIETLSGNVDVLVSPQEGSSDALLDVSSVSGRVAVVEPVDQPDAVPLRRYLTSVSSASGDIDARVAFTEGGIESQSGDITARLLPGLGPRHVLHTGTKSGRSAVTVLEPLGGKLALTSAHHSVSGAVGLAYPASWEGSFSMTSISGHQTVIGDGVEWGREGGWMPKIEGSKGSGPCQLTVEGVAGDQELAIGSS